MKKADLINEALEMLKEDDELFVDMVNELDSWNGYADGFRAYQMEELDDLFCGVTVSKFLGMLASGFDHTNKYFVDTIYGIDSTNDIVDLYRSHVDEDELLDEIIDKYNHLYFDNDDFEELVKQIVNYSEEEQEPALNSIKDRMREGFEEIAAAATRKEGVTA